MSATRLDPTFGAALRAELVARVVATSGLQQVHPDRPRSRSRRWLLGGGAVAVVVAMAGTAYAVSSTAPGGTAPGGTEIVGQAADRTSTHTGSATIDLGPRPATATAVQVEFSCLSAGSFTFPDGSSLVCDRNDLHRPAGAPALTEGIYDLSPGQHTVTVTTAAGVGWETSTRYVSTHLTDWGVNAKGQTYGVQNEHGEPDLLVAQATNGHTGYVYTGALNNAGGPPPTDPSEALAHNRALTNGITIPVYESDGDTVIGQFVIGGDVSTHPRRPAQP